MPRVNPQRTTVIDGRTAASIPALCPRGPAWNRAARRPWKRSDLTDDQVLDRVRHAPSGFWALVDQGIPPKVVRAKFYQMTARGLLDYGVSVETAWAVEPRRFITLPPPMTFDLEATGPLRICTPLRVHVDDLPTHELGPVSFEHAVETHGRPLREDHTP